jgi:hypothetical protein
MKTVIQELIEKSGWSKESLFCQDLLEKEKKQIIKAWNNHRYNKWGNENTIVDGEHYYNETFNHSNPNQ